MADAPAAAPAAPSTAPATDALSWMNDDNNFKTGSPAEQQAYDLPTTDRPHSRPVVENMDGLTGESPGSAEKLGGEQTKSGEKTAREALAEQLGTKADTEKEAAAEVPGYTLDETGKWHRPDGAFADSDEVKAIEDVLAAEGGKMAPTSSAPDAPKQPATKQPIGDVVITAGGKAVDGIPDLKITYKADGKTLENVPLDKLIRKAQLGEYNAQREADIEQRQQQFLGAQQRMADLEAANKQYEEHYAQILTNEAFYRAAQQQLINQQSPEARLAESQRQLQVVAQQQTEQAKRNEATAYVQQHIAPRINQIAAMLPQDEVMQSAFYGKMALLTTPYMVNGKVPVERLPDVVRIIEGPLTQWAEQVGLSRSAEAAAELKQARQQVEATKVALTLAKKQAARNMAPRGRAGAIRETPKPLPAPKTAEEANDRMFAQIEQQYSGTPS